MLKKTLTITIIMTVLTIVLIGSYFFIKSQQEEDFIEPVIEIKNEIVKPKNKVLIIHSYHKEWGWNQDTEKGIVEGLKRKGFILNKDYQLEKFYMDTKNTYTTEEQIKQRADKAIKMIDDIKPDLVFINDDNALKYVAANYPDEKVPFIFLGINCDPEIIYPEKIASLEEPGHNITGILERFPYYESFSLAKKIFPEKESVVLLADNSPSSSFLVNAFKERFLESEDIEDHPLEVLGVIQITTFREWKEIVKKYQDKSDFLGILTYHQLKDEKGIIVPPSEVVLWTIENNKLPELGFLLFHAEDGFWSAIGVSPYKNGIYVGTLAGEVLEGKDVDIIPIQDIHLIDIAFNVERSKMLGIEIPINILTMATKIFRNIKIPRY